MIENNDTTMFNSGTTTLFVFRSLSLTQKQKLLSKTKRCYNVKKTSLLKSFNIFIN